MSALEQWCRVVVKMREQGASVRDIARVLDMSKSTLHRQMPAIEAIAAEVSQMGQRADEKSAVLRCRRSRKCPEWDRRCAMSTGTCANCGKHSYLMRLHGDKGGPLMCPICAGEWNAKHTRRRKFGRILAKAANLYFENGGKIEDAKTIICTAGLGRLGMLPRSLDPFGYAADTLGTEIGDITAELLADVLQLTHPDRHPPERHELANRVTQELLSLQPFVLPAPKPKPTPVYSPSREPYDNETEEIIKRHRERREATARQRAYPCELCAETVPYFYCDPCKVEYRKRKDAELERHRAKQREQYAQRQQRKRWRRPPKLCAADACTAQVKANRKDAKYCSPACRQRAHRQRVTGISNNVADTSPIRNGSGAAP